MRKKINITIDEELVETLKLEADSENRSLSRYIENVLLKRHNERKKGA